MKGDEERVKRERPDWLKLLDTLPPCEGCGVIAGPCLCDIVEGLQNTEDHYVCDCEVNYGKDCKYPSKYREGGCNG